MRTVTGILLSMTSPSTSMYSFVALQQIRRSALQEDLTLACCPKVSFVRRAIALGLEHICTLLAFGTRDLQLLWHVWAGERRGWLEQAFMIVK